MNEGRIKVGIGPEQLMMICVCLTLNLRIGLRYKNSIDEFMVCLEELWPSKLTKPQIFSTVLGGT